MAGPEPGSFGTHYLALDMVGPYLWSVLTQSGFFGTVES